MFEKGSVYPLKWGYEVMSGVVEADARPGSRLVEKSGSVFSGREIESEGGEAGAAQTSMASTTLNDGEVGQTYDGTGLGYSFPV